MPALRLTPLRAGAHGLLAIPWYRWFSKSDESAVVSPFPDRSLAPLTGVSPVAFPANQLPQKIMEKAPTGCPIGALTCGCATR